jgi:transposase
MKNFLSEEEKADLKIRHRRERDGRTKDRIKAVLLSDSGWSYVRIAEALFLDEDTISKHVHEYVEQKKLKIETGGSESKLSAGATDELVAYLTEHTFDKSCDICEYVRKKYGVSYTVPGMTSWLKNHDFSHIKPHEVPAKADPEKQKQFVEEYEKMKQETPKDEPILFLDGVHPTIATKVSYGWIKKGTRRTIGSTAAKTRENILGTIDLLDMKVCQKSFPTVNSKFMMEFFDFLRTEYPNARKIHVILDNASYNKANDTRKHAEKLGIVLHFLPPYSPNLNAIERLWKVMNEYARNNRYFPNASTFREALKNFFSVTWLNIANNMKTRINDNFHIVDKPNFSS